MGVSLAWMICGLVFFSSLDLCSTRNNARKYGKEDLERLRDEVSAMFHHAYDGYLRHAYPYDELRPLSCDGVDTWGSYSLTLIDALDTLAVVGNYSEFRRVYDIIASRPNFDSDINVSVFETNIRILGGLISGHLLAHRAKVKTEPGWPCQGPLLRLAEDVAERLLPAFDTPTGMPYGTVNLRHGVPENETPVTCTAGVGTFVVEFGALSRLTGNPIYEEVALRALRSLWYQRSPIGLVGNHIDVLTGKWTATDAGIGAGVDSYYEYLVKGSILLQRPELMKMFKTSQESVEQYMKHDDWHFWVAMAQGTVSMPIFQSLEAFWPGLLSLVGDNMKGMKTIHNYHQVWKQYGFLPEFYNVAQGGASSKRESYPLRPELIESAMYLYRATRDPFLLALGEDMLHSINFSAKTECGYATVKDVRDHTLEDRMESFFLSETTKYLYLLFDVDSFVHNPGTTATLLTTAHGKCVIDAGGYIFNTEAHPVDPAALACCSAHTEEEIEKHISSHMLDVLDPTGRSFQEFQGDLIPARIRQIEDAREEEDRKRRERREEYLRKMEEQRARERETVRKRQDLDAMRKQRQKEINETTTVAPAAAEEEEEEETQTKLPSTKEQEDVNSVGELDFNNGEAEVDEIVGTGTVEIVPISSIYGDTSETVRVAENGDAAKHQSEEKDVNVIEEEKPASEEVQSINSSAGAVAEQAVPEQAVPELDPAHLYPPARDDLVEGDRTPPPVEDEGPPTFAANDEGRPKVIAPPPPSTAAKDREGKQVVAGEQQQLPLFSQLQLQPPKLKSAATGPANVVEALADILSKLLPSKRREFDYDEFRERVLKKEDYKLKQEWYEDHFLMSCPAQSFLARFSLQGEFFENYD